VGERRAFWRLAGFLMASLVLGTVVLFGLVAGEVEAGLMTFDSPPPLPPPVEYCPPTYYLPLVMQNCGEGCPPPPGPAPAPSFPYSRASMLVLWILWAGLKGARVLLRFL
jgi:hypothetical protein